MKNILLGFVLFMAMFVAGCQTLQNASSNELLVTYATMKVIEESDEITSADVRETVEKARSVLEADVTVSIDDFKAEVAEQIGWSELAPSDKLLIAAIVDEVQVSLEKQYEVDVLSDEVVIRIEQFLDMVEQAAILSGE